MPKPVKEPENVDDPPEESSEDEGDGTVSAEFHDSSSDDGLSGDIHRSVFTSKSELVTTSASTGGRDRAKGKEAVEGPEKAPQKRSIRANKRNKPEHIDTSDDDSFRSKKARVGSDRIADEVGAHMKPEALSVLGTGKKPVQKGYGKSNRKLHGSGSTSRNKFQKSRLRTDSPSPEKHFKTSAIASIQSSPDKPRLFQRSAKDEGSSSDLSDPPPSDKSDPPRALDKPVSRGKPRRRPAKKGKNELTDFDAEPMTQPTFKMPNAYQDYAPEDMLAVDTTIDDVPVEKTKLDPGMALCPMCGEQVDEEMLKQFSKGNKMRVAQQAKFCRKHKKDSAEKTYTTMKYPKIDWTTLESRIECLHDYLESLIMGTDSYFGGILAENIRIGQDRTLLTTKEYPTPGYYGLRGMSIMTEAVTETFAKLLRKRAPTDKRVSGRGYTGFVQSVLVPELAVKLIQEDLSLDEEQAREVMIESRAVGEILNDEKRHSQSSRAHIANDPKSQDEEAKEKEREEQDEENNVKSDGDIPFDSRISNVTAGSDSDLSSPTAQSPKQGSINGESSGEIDKSDSDRSLASLGGKRSKNSVAPAKKQDVIKLPARISPRSGRNTKQRIAVPVNREISDNDDSDSSGISDLSSGLGPL